jgi:hypothetical protein
MKKLLILLPLLLAGCATSPIYYTPEFKVVQPPEALYSCPTVNKFPKANTLTNKELGQLVIQLQKNNLQCKDSIDAIKRYLADAEKAVAAK